MNEILKWVDKGKKKLATEKARIFGQNDASAQENEAERQQFEAALKRLVKRKDQDFVYRFLDLVQNMDVGHSNPLSLTEVDLAILKKYWPGSQVRLTQDAARVLEGAEAKNQPQLESVRATIRQVQQLLTVLKQAEEQTNVSLSAEPVDAAFDRQTALSFLKDTAGFNIVTGAYNYKFSKTDFTPLSGPATASSLVEQGQTIREYAISYDGDVPRLISIDDSDIHLPNPLEITGKNYASQMPDRGSLVMLEQLLNQLFLNNPDLQKVWADRKNSVETLLDLTAYRAILSAYQEQQLALPRVKEDSEAEVENPPLARAVALAALKNHWPTSQIFLHDQHADLLEIQRRFRLEPAFSKWEGLCLQGLQLLQKADKLSPTPEAASSQELELNVWQKLLLKISERLRGIG